jgi:hypothetical protein
MFDPTNIGDVLVSHVRTYTPVAVGTLLAWVASRGLDLTGYSNAVNVFVVPIVIAVYYAGARLLERKWPVFGLLLGSRRQPTYVQPVIEPEVERADTEARLLGDFSPEKYNPAGGDRYA